MLWYTLVSVHLFVRCGHVNEKHELYVIDEEFVPEVLKKAYNA